MGCFRSSEYVTFFLLLQFWTGKLTCTATVPFIVNSRFDQNIKSSLITRPVLPLNNRCNMVNFTSAEVFNKEMSILSM